MPQPEGSQLNNGFSGILTDLAISYLPNFSNGTSADGLVYIAKQVFPNISVGAPSAQYNIWKAGDFMRLDMKALANDEAPPIVGFTGTKGTYSVQNYGVSAYWTARDLAEARRGGTSEQQLIDMKTLHVTAQGILMLESEVSTLIQTSSNWSFTVAGVASAPTAGVTFIAWDQAASNPIADIDYWKRMMKLATGRVPNTLIIPEIVWNMLKNNANLIGRITYDGRQAAPTQVTQDQFKALTGIPNILVPNGVYNSAPEGSTQTFVEFWGKNVWLGFVSPQPSIQTPSAGYHFSWVGDSALGLPVGMGGGTAPAQFGSIQSPDGLFIRRYMTERPSRQWVDSELWTTPNVTAPDLGFLATAVMT